MCFAGRQTNRHDGFDTGGFQTVAASRCQFSYGDGTRQRKPLGERRIGGPQFGAEERRQFAARRLEIRAFVVGIGREEFPLVASGRPLVTTFEVEVRG